MATKCIDQMAVPVTTAAAAAQHRPLRPGRARARRSRSRAAQAPMTATTMEAATPTGLCAPIRPDMVRARHCPCGRLQTRILCALRDRGAETSEPHLDFGQVQGAGGGCRERLGSDMPPLACALGY